MAAYKDLVGQKITKVTSNPGEPKTGQMWYNSTDGALRGLGITTAWVTGGTYLNKIFGVKKCSEIFSIFLCKFTLLKKPKAPKSSLVGSFLKVLIFFVS